VLSQKRLLLIAAVLQIVWGFVPTASKLVIDEIPIELYISLRWTISGVIFAIYLTLTKRWQKVGLRDAGWIAFLGVLGYGVASLGTLYGLKIGGVINFALVAAVGPVITSVIAMIFLRERPQKLFYFSLLVSVLGLLLLAIGKYQISSFAIAGQSVGFILSACVLEAIVFVFSKKFKDRVSAIQYLAIAQLSAAILMWSLQGAVHRQTAALAQLTLTGILAALFVSIVACVLCYTILYWLLNYIDGHRLALFDGFHALSATVFGFMFFNEPFRPLMILGGVLVLSGLVMGNWPQPVAEKDPE